MPSLVSAPAKEHKSSVKWGVDSHLERSIVVTIDDQSNIWGKTSDVGETKAPISKGTIGVSHSAMKSITHLLHQVRGIECGNDSVSIR